MKHDAIHDVMDAVSRFQLTLADMGAPIVRKGSEFAWNTPRLLFSPTSIARRRADKRELFACMLDAVLAGVPREDVMRSPLQTLSRLDDLRRHYRRSTGYWDEIKDDPRIALSIAVHSTRRAVIEDAILFYLHALLNSSLPKTPGEFEVESRGLKLANGVCLEGKPENEVRFLTRNRKGWRAEILEPFCPGEGAYEASEWFARPCLKVRVALSKEDHLLWQVGFSGKALA